MEPGAAVYLYLCGAGGVAGAIERSVGSVCRAAAGYLCPLVRHTEQTLSLTVH